VRVRVMTGAFPLMLLVGFIRRLSSSTAHSAVIVLDGIGVGEEGVVVGDGPRPAHWPRAGQPASQG
jgi:hypothetical protein